MPFGYNGKILKVDLSTSSYAVEEKDERFFRTFLGGSALAAYYLLTEMRPRVDPLGPDNVLVFATSVVVGAPVPGASRFTVAAKSPLTGAMGQAEAGGYFGPELKKAGFEAIVVKGRADRPTWLWIHDGGVEFRDAAGLWGHDTGYAQGRIRGELGDEKVRVACIGQAGENQVRYACVVNELKHTNGRTGMGAVMGAKNLKAVAVRGSKMPAFHDREALNRINRSFVEVFRSHPIQGLLYDGGTIGWDIESLDAGGILPTKNFRGGHFDEYEKITLNAMKDTILQGRGACSGCPNRCKLVCGGGKFDIDPEYGGPEYETAGAFAPNLLVGDPEVYAKAHELCNRYTLDTISTGVTIAFAMDCYEAGLLTKEQTGGLDLRFGNGRAVLELIEAIAFKRGLGALLAEGSVRAAKEIGRGAERFVRAVKGQEIAMHEPRGKAGIGLAFALSPWGADHVQAPHDLLFEEGKFGVDDLKELGIYRGTPGRDIGPDKVRFFYYGQQTWNLFNTLSMCCFVIGPGKLLKMGDLVSIVNAATGWNGSLFELMKAGERTVTLGRLFAVREGFTVADDVLPEVFYQPSESGLLTGRKIDRAAFVRAVQLYYEMMGWDAKTGEPKESKLVELGIADLGAF
ncbi:MAG TPA: aldehyde ferredoxin oxidoreductase family protein [Bacillota bacterium]|jgi:aldehyde:ferredoxin oxidoreductase